MNIKRQEIEKLATLARIAIDESTIAEVTERLGSVLELVDQLQAVRYRVVSRPCLTPCREPSVCAKMR